MFFLVLLRIHTNQPLLTSPPQSPHLLRIDDPSEGQVLHVPEVTVALEEVDVYLANGTVVPEHESHDGTVREEDIIRSQHAVDAFVLRTHVEAWIS